MKEYKNVLLALELDPETDNLIIKKAKEIVEGGNAKLTLLHAVEHFSSYGAAYGVAAGVDVEEVLSSEAEKSMAKIGKVLNIDKSDQIVTMGPAKQVILEEAEKRKVDLIILGSHGRHGVRLLLGSTANAVLHSSNCDVLAVRVRD